MHGLLLLKLLYLLLATLSLVFSFLAFFFTFSFFLLSTSLLLGGLSFSHCTSGSFTLGVSCVLIFIVFIRTFMASIHALIIWVFESVVFATGKHLVFEHLLESFDTLLEEITHFMNSKCSNIGCCFQCLDCEFFKLKHIIKLLLEFV